MHRGWSVTAPPCMSPLLRKEAKHFRHNLRGTSATDYAGRVTYRYLSARSHCRSRHLAHVLMFTGSLDPSPPRLAGASGLRIPTVASVCRRHVDGHPLDRRHAAPLLRNVGITLWTNGRHHAVPAPPPTPHRQGLWSTPPPYMTGLAWLGGRSAVGIILGRL